MQEANHYKNIFHWKFPSEIKKKYQRETGAVSKWYFKIRHLKFIFTFFTCFEIRQLEDNRKKILLLFRNFVIDI